VLFGIVAKLRDVIPDLIERDGCGHDLVARVEHRLDEARADLAARLATF